MIKRHFFILFVVFLELVFSACKTKNEMHLSSKTYRALLDKCPNIGGKEIELYYMDGTCSFCIAKAQEIEKGLRNKPDWKALFVVRSSNKELTDFYFKEQKIESCIIYDTDSIMKNSNIRFNEVVKISQDLVMTEVRDKK